MFKTLLAVATMTATLVGPALSQSIQVDASTALGRTALCQDKWKANQDPTVKAIGSQLYLKSCRDHLKAKKSLADFKAPKVTF